MKKLLSITLVLMLCMGFFTGCGNNENVNVVTKTKADADDVTIDVWSGDAGSQASWEKLVGEWNATKGEEKNIFINWVTNTDNTKNDVAEQNGTLPHLFAGSSMQLKKFIVNGSAMAIDELPGGPEYIKEYALAGQDGSNMKDGKTYTLRTTANTAGLIINEDLFVKAGIVDENGKAKAPTTMSELREAAKKITNASEQIYGYVFPGKFSLYFTVEAQTAHSFGYKGTKEGREYIDFDAQEVHFDGYKDTYQWLFDLRDDGSLFPGAETLDNDTARAYFAVGKAGMFPAISWDVSVFNTQFPAEFNWRVVEFPVLDGHENTGLYTTDIGGGMIIGRKAAEKNPQETMEVLKFITSIETRAARFEDGSVLSAKKDVLEKVDESKIDKNFLQFAEFVRDDANYATEETYVNEGEPWKDLFGKAWAGDITLDEAIEIHEKNATKGLRKAIQDGKYDVERQKRVYEYIQGDNSQDITFKNW